MYCSSFGHLGTTWVPPVIQSNQGCSNSTCSYGPQKAIELAYDYEISFHLGTFLKHLLCWRLKSSGYADQFTVKASLLSPFHHQSRTEWDEALARIWPSVSIHWISLGFIYLKKKQKTKSNKNSCLESFQGPVTIKSISIKKIDSMMGGTGQWPCLLFVLPTSFSSE